jgi:UDP-GlcNAc3NAcA epimerase
MRVLSVVGARPQFVKAGVVSTAMRELGGIDEVMVHTGQHYDANMSDIFFRELAIPEPRYNLGVGSGAHGAQTAQMLDGLERLMLNEQPDVVLTYGDTNSTLAATIAASKAHFPVAHVEAGLRSFNRRMPEEINRIVADSVSDLLFAPTQGAFDRLVFEGHSRDEVVLSGDVMFDATLAAAGVARRESTMLTGLSLTGGAYLLATIHRAENTDDTAVLTAIVESLELVSARWPVVWPLHPRTRKALDRAGLLDRAQQQFRVIDPVGFIDMVRLEMGAARIATDSGGVQKEAFFHRVPCFVLRGETEWVELTESGHNLLVPPGDSADMAARMLAHEAPSYGVATPYGDGAASIVIARTLLERWQR